MRSSNDAYFNELKRDFATVWSTNTTGFSSPLDIAYCRINKCSYVADTGNHRICKIRDSCDALEQTIVAGAVAGHVDGPQNIALFRCPTSIAVGPQGDIYVSDAGNKCVRRISNHDIPIVSTIASGFWPGAIAVDEKGNVCVADREELRVISPEGDIRVLRHHACVNGRPRSMAIGVPGTVLIASHGDGRIMKLYTHDARVKSLAGGFCLAGFRDAKGRRARFNRIRGMAMGVDGALYVADSKNGRIRIVEADGMTNTLVSNLVKPQGLTIDELGYLLVLTNEGNCVKMIDIRYRELSGNRGEEGMHRVNENRSTRRNGEEDQVNQDNRHQSKENDVEEEDDGENQRQRAGGGKAADEPEPEQSKRPEQAREEEREPHDESASKALREAKKHLDLEQKYTQILKNGFILEKQRTQEMEEYAREIAMRYQVLMKHEEEVRKKFTELAQRSERTEAALVAQVAQLKLELEEERLKTKPSRQEYQQATAPREARDEVYRFIDSISMGESEELGALEELISHESNDVIDNTNSTSKDGTTELPTKEQVSGYGPNEEAEVRDMVEKSMKIPLVGIQALQQMYYKEEIGPKEAGQMLLPKSEVDKIFNLPTEGPYPEAGKLIEALVWSSIDASLALTTGRGVCSSKDVATLKKRENGLISAIKDASMKIENGEAEPGAKSKLAEFVEREEKAMELIQCYDSLIKRTSTSCIIAQLQGISENTVRQLEAHKAWGFRRIWYNENGASIASERIRKLELFLDAKRHAVTEAKATFEDQKKSHAATIQAAVSALNDPVIPVALLRSTIRMVRNQRAKIDILRAEENQAMELVQGWKSEWEIKIMNHIKDIERVKNGLKVVDGFHQWYPSMVNTLIHHATQNIVSDPETNSREKIPVQILEQKLLVLTDALHAQLESEEFEASCDMAIAEGQLERVKKEKCDMRLKNAGVDSPTSENERINECDVMGGGKNTLKRKSIKRDEKGISNERYKKSLRERHFWKILDRKAEETRTKIERIQTELRRVRKLKSECEEYARRYKAGAVPRGEQEWGCEENRATNGAYANQGKDESSLTFSNDMGLEFDANGWIQEFFP